MRDDCIVRRVERDDLPDLVDMCGEHARYERADYDPRGKAALLERALFGPAPRLVAWVADSGGEHVGYATVTEEFSTWAARSFLHMDCLFVHHNHRGAGIGAALLAEIVRFANDQGHTEVQWQTPAWNASAARFYRRHGATDLAKLRFRFSTA